MPPRQVGARRGASRIHETRLACIGEAAGGEEHDPISQSDDGEAEVEGTGTPEPPVLLAAGNVSFNEWRRLGTSVAGPSGSGHRSRVPPRTATHKATSARSLATPVRSHQQLSAMSSNQHRSDSRAATPIVPTPDSRAATPIAHCPDTSFVREKCQSVVLQTDAAPPQVPEMASGGMSSHHSLSMQADAVAPHGDHAQPSGPMSAIEHELSEWSTLAGVGQQEIRSMAASPVGFGPCGQPSHPGGARSDMNQSVSAWQQPAGPSRGNATLGILECISQLPRQCGTKLCKLDAGSTPTFGGDVAKTDISTAEMQQRSATPQEPIALQGDSESALEVDWTALEPDGAPSMGLSSQQSYPGHSPSRLGATSMAAAHPKASAVKAEDHHHLGSSPERLIVTDMFATDMKAAPAKAQDLHAPQYSKSQQPASTSTRHPQAASAASRHSTEDEVGDRKSAAGVPGKRMAAVSPAPADAAKKRLRREPASRDKSTGEGGPEKLTAVTRSPATSVSEGADSLPLTQNSKRACASAQKALCKLFTSKPARRAFGLPGGTRDSESAKPQCASR